MNIITTKSEGPIVGHDDVYKTNITGRRWALVLNWFNISWERQIESDSKWRSAGEYFNAGVAATLKFGYYSIWYDGPHKVIWVGPFYFGWSR